MVNDVYIFLDVDECIEFIIYIKGARTFATLSGALELGQIAVTTVYDKSQVTRVHYFVRLRFYTANGHHNDLK